MKTTKKTFIAVSMIGFAAMMFSCAGTKKDAPASEETTSAVQSEAPTEAPVEEKSLSIQDTLQSENPTDVQEELPQNNDVSVPAAE